MYPIFYLLEGDYRLHKDAHATLPQAAWLLIELIRVLNTNVPLAIKIGSHNSNIFTPSGNRRASVELPSRPSTEIRLKAAAHIPIVEQVPLNQPWQTKTACKLIVLSAKIPLKTPSVSCIPHALADPKVARLRTASPKQILQPMRVTTSSLKEVRKMTHDCRTW